MFVKFKWENITEITGSLGNFMYLMASVILILSSLVPLTFIFLLNLLVIYNASISLGETIFFYSVLFTIQIYLCFCIKKIGFYAAVKTLEPL